MNALDDAMAHIDIKGVSCDSRRVGPGYVFAALPGSRADGRAFIAHAAARGAAAILVPADSGDLPAIDIPYVRDPDPRRRYARMAAAFYGRQPAHIGAVTGTNGKTSVAWFARQLMNAAGLTAASAGTLGLMATAADGAGMIDSVGQLTTPDPADLHRDLRDLADAGVDHLAIEASSHGLDQRRLDGVRIRAAAFTNLSRDHLDYHKTEDAYLAAKLRLFDTLLIEGGIAIVNADARFADAFVAAARGRGIEVLQVGAGPACEYRILDVRPRPDGLDLRFLADGAETRAALPLIGAFQASNALVALALAHALGADFDAARDGLGRLRAAPGRMQLSGRHPAGAGVFVDYAHTPDALATVLAAVRPHAPGRVHVVFGCGGDRDPGKRPEMGRIAAENADVVIVTDDNPRTENAAAIRKAVLAGARGAIEIAERRAAIRTAVAGLAAGDVLVVAGKGHERGQTVGTEVIPFDDTEEVRAALGELTA